jgi:hypothetical protein
MKSYLIEREGIYLNAKPSPQTSTAHSNVLIPSDTPIDSRPRPERLWSSKVSRANVKIVHKPFICKLKLSFALLASPSFRWVLTPNTTGR